jgi:hypothetical protein
LMQHRPILLPPDLDVIWPSLPLLTLSIFRLLCHLSATNRLPHNLQSFRLQHLLSVSTEQPSSPPVDLLLLRMSRS